MDILADSDTSGISVLRSFRLLRIFKLVRFMPALQRQLSVMIKTLDNVMTFLALLLLFIFTSSILGMHLFGGKYQFPDEDGQLVTSRANFDTLFWALVTVFQVGTQPKTSQTCCWLSILAACRYLSTSCKSLSICGLLVCLSVNCLV